MTTKVRQAVVVIHGMGEQRPLDTLNRFIQAALPPGPDGKVSFYSRPDPVTTSYESRRYLAPRKAGPDGWELYAQTEFYEYHWAHLMRGNRLDDLWPTLRRVLLQLPTTVPANLRLVWALVWLLILGVAWAFVWGPLAGLDLGALSVQGVVGALVGGGVAAAVAAYLVARVLPAWITGGFVDVVRYVDTSPRSYRVRRDVRRGIVNLLRGLHASGRYQRIIVVGHGPGSFIGYDAISYLWGRMHGRHAPAGTSGGEREVSPDGLEELEQAASDLTDGSDPEAFRAAQRRLWLGLRRQGNPWLITDFVTLGSPMYLADRLHTRNRRQFDARVDQREFPTCPPQPEPAAYNNVNHTRLWYSWAGDGVRLLYHAAPFAVVRWTNLWFPAGLGLFGDWLGGPLVPLFGPGIKDLPVRGNRPWRYLPGYAHALYFRLPQADAASVRHHLREAMDLASTGWLAETRPTAPAPEPTRHAG